MIIFKNLGRISNWQESKWRLLFGVHTCRGRMYNEFGVQYMVGQHSMHLILTMSPLPPPTHSPPMHPFWIDAQIASKLSSTMQNIVWMFFHIPMFGFMIYVNGIWIQTKFLHQWNMKAQWIISKKKSTM
jgi:hypothetical protein